MLAKLYFPQSKEWAVMWPRLGGATFSGVSTSASSGTIPPDPCCIPEWSVHSQPTSNGASVFFVSKSRDGASHASNGHPNNFDGGGGHDTFSYRLVVPTAHTNRAGCEVYLCVDQRTGRVLGACLSAQHTVQYRSVSMAHKRPLAMLLPAQRVQSVPLLPLAERLKRADSTTAEDLLPRLETCVSFVATGHGNFDGPLDMTMPSVTFDATTVEEYDSPTQESPEKLTVHGNRQDFTQDSLPIIPGLGWRTSLCAVPTFVVLKGGGPLYVEDVATASDYLAERKEQIGKHGGSVTDAMLAINLELVDAAGEQAVWKNKASNNSMAFEDPVLSAIEGEMLAQLTSPTREEDDGEGHVKGHGGDGVDVDGTRRQSSTDRGDGGKARSRAKKQSAAKAQYEITGIVVGGTGCGKTQLLRTILKLAAAKGTKVEEAQTSLVGVQTQTAVVDLMKHSAVAAVAQKKKDKDKDEKGRPSVSADERPATAQKVIMQQLEKQLRKQLRMECRMKVFDPVGIHYTMPLSSGPETPLAASATLPIAAHRRGEPDLGKVAEALLSPAYVGKRHPVSSPVILFGMFDYADTFSVHHLQAFIPVVQRRLHEELGLSLWIPPPAPRAAAQPAPATLGHVACRRSVVTVFVGRAFPHKPILVQDEVMREISRRNGAVFCSTPEEASFFLRGIAESFATDVFLRSRGWHTGATQHMLQWSRGETNSLGQSSMSSWWEAAIPRVFVSAPKVGSFVSSGLPLLAAARLFREVSFLEAECFANLLRTDVGPVGRQPLVLSAEVHRLVSQVLLGRDSLTATQVLRLFGYFGLDISTSQVKQLFPAEFDVNRDGAVDAEDFLDWLRHGPVVLRRSWRDAAASLRQQPVDSTHWLLVILYCRMLGSPWKFAAFCWTEQRDSTTASFGGMSADIAALGARPVDGDQRKHHEPRSPSNHQAAACSRCSAKFSLHRTKIICPACDRYFCAQCMGDVGGEGTAKACLGCCFKDIAAPWTPDESVTACTNCLADFTLLRRKHHCRRCGKIFCRACSSHLVLLAGFDKPQRVCDSCCILSGKEASAKISAGGIPRNGPLPAPLVNEHYAALPPAVRAAIDAAVPDANVFSTAELHELLTEFPAMQGGGVLALPPAGASDAVDFSRVLDWNDSYCSCDEEELLQLQPIGGYLSTA